MPSAKLLKGAATIAGTFGLSALYGGKRLRISGGSALAEIFGGGPLVYAFFTGTNSPHRKAAIQIMDLAGNIRGFAKVSRNPAVAELLTREAETLRNLESLDLQSAVTPHVLFSGQVNGATVLVTDTLKTRRSRMSTKFQANHLSFLRELALKGTSSSASENPISLLANKLSRVERHLSVDWQRRLSSAVKTLFAPDVDLGPLSLSHGDFTPWNTFIVDDRLYVFDWEYAAQNQPFGGDIIQFLLALPNAHRPIEGTVQFLKHSLYTCGVITNPALARDLLLYYCCWRSLHYILREPEERRRGNEWDREKDMAALLDYVLLEKTV